MPGANSGIAWANQCDLNMTHLTTHSIHLTVMVISASEIVRYMKKKTYQNPPLPLTTKNPPTPSPTLKTTNKQAKWLTDWNVPNQLLTPLNHLLPWICNWNMSLYFHNIQLQFNWATMDTKLSSNGLTPSKGCDRPSRDTYLWSVLCLLNNLALH